MKNEDEQATTGSHFPFSKPLFGCFSHNYGAGLISLMQKSNIVLKGKPK